MKRGLAIAVLFAAAFAALFVPRHKTLADTPLTLNPMLYDCIKDSGVVSRTTTYDANNTNKQCDMVVTTGNATTVYWSQSDPMAFSGSILNWNPPDQSAWETAISGINQVPTSFPNGSAAPVTYTTARANLSITRLSVSVNPAPPVGYALTFQMDDSQQRGGLSCTITGPANSCVGTQNPPFFYTSGDEIDLQISNGCNGGVPCPFMFSSVAWTAQ